MNDMDVFLHSRRIYLPTYPKTNSIVFKISWQSMEKTQIHEQLHIAHNIYLIGAHQNIHSGPAEHNHIEITKKASQHVQKRTKTFDSQLSQRLNDHISVDCSHTKITDQQNHSIKFALEHCRMLDSLNI